MQSHNVPLQVAASEHNLPLLLTTSCSKLSENMLFLEYREPNHETMLEVRQNLHLEAARVHRQSFTLPLMHAAQKLRHSLDTDTQLPCIMKPREAGLQHHEAPEKDCNIGLQETIS